MNELAPDGISEEEFIKACDVALLDAAELIL